MSDDHQTHSRRLHLEASRIALSRSDAGPDAVRSALDAWAGADSARRAAADRALRAWAATTPRRRSTSRGVLGLLVVATVVGLSAWQIASTRQADVSSGLTALTSVELADGVVADLDAGTALDIGRRDGSVVIVLRDGAVHVAVDHETAAPVSVMVAGVTAKVTGTRFEVAAVGGGAYVAVSEGTVIVSPHTGSMRRAQVSAGQIWRGDARNGSVGEIAPEDVAAWRAGWLIADNRPLQEVVEAIDRRFPGAVFILGDALGAQPVTGSYRLDDPLSALRAAASARGAKVRTVTPWIAVISWE